MGQGIALCADLTHHQRTDGMQAQGRCMLGQGRDQADRQARRVQPKGDPADAGGTVGHEISKRGMTR